MCRVTHDLSFFFGRFGRFFFGAGSKLRHVASRLRGLLVVLLSEFPDDRTSAPIAGDKR
jgi:hypothetical protein